MIVAGRPDALHPLHYLLLFCSYSRSSRISRAKLHICAIFPFGVITLYIYMYQYDTKDAFMKLIMFSTWYRIYVNICRNIDTYVCVCVCLKKNYSINLGLEKVYNSVKR